MRKVISILFILFSVTWSFAQVTDNSEWKIFTGYQEEFTINAPIGFELGDYDKKEADSPKSYRGNMGGISFAVWTAKDVKASDFGTISSFIQNNNADGVDRKIDSFKSKVFSFIDSESYAHEIAFIETDSRFFIFHLFSPTTNKEKFAKFFDSIQINKTFSQKNPLSVAFPTSQKKTAKTETRISPPVNVDNAVTGKGQGSGGGMRTGQGSGQKTPAIVASDGIGTGQGSGRGSGSGSGKPVENKPLEPETVKPVSVTEPLQILSKPRANYTDMARIYWIQGTVTLRVTFLANGSIGTVSIVSKLPLGLTSTAIAAARSLRFKPAQRNGVPYTVTKQVQYNFTLY